MAAKAAKDKNAAAVLRANEGEDEPIAVPGKAGGLNAGSNGADSAADGERLRGAQAANPLRGASFQAVLLTAHRVLEDLAVAHSRDVSGSRSGDGRVPAGDPDQCPPSGGPAPCSAQLPERPATTPVVDRRVEDLDRRVDHHMSTGSAQSAARENMVPSPSRATTVDKGKQRAYKIWKRFAMPGDGAGQARSALRLSMDGSMNGLANMGRTPSLRKGRSSDNMSTMKPPGWSINRSSSSNLSWYEEQGPDWDEDSDGSREEVFCGRCPWHQSAFAEWLVSNPLFETFSGMIILGSTIFIGLDVQYHAIYPDAPNDEYAMVHVGFNVAFWVELIIRMSALGPYFFKGVNWKWNIFDLFLVIAATFSDILFVILSFVSSMSMGSVQQSIKIFRILRLAKMVRLVRMFRGVREFHKMLYALGSSMRTLVCSLAILFFVVYVFGIVFCQAYIDAVREGRAESIENLEDFYGDLPKCFFSLFIASCNGLSWKLVWQPMADVNHLYGSAFVVYVVFVLFGVMNVVTSVFVDSAVSSSQHYRDVLIAENQHSKHLAMRHIRQVFAHITEGETGDITISQMEEFLQRPDLRAYVEALNISSENSQMLFRLLDRDGSKTIDIEEWCEGCLRLQGEAKSFDVHVQLYQMRQFMVRWTAFTQWIVERLTPEEEDDQSDEDADPKMVQVAPATDAKAADTEESREDFFCL